MPPMLLSQFPWTHGGRTRNSLHVDMHPPPEVSGGRRRLRKQTHPPPLDLFFAASTANLGSRIFGFIASGKSVLSEILASRHSSVHTEAQNTLALPPTYELQRIAMSSTIEACRCRVQPFCRPWETMSYRIRPESALLSFPGNVCSECITN